MWDRLPRKTVDCGEEGRRRHITDTIRTKRGQDVDRQGPRSRTRGDADDDDSSRGFWGDAGFDAEHACACVSAVARGNWTC
jgi:hypothetical protein